MEMKFHKDLGSVLIIVLILLAMTTVSVMASMRSSVTQFNLVNKRNLFEQAEQATDSAVQCVFSQLNESSVKMWLDYSGNRPDFDLQANESRYPSGCASTTELIQRYKFNHMLVDAYTEYCGVGLFLSHEVSDPDFFQKYRFQTWVVGRSSSDPSVVVKIVRGWEIILPRDLFSVPDDFSRKCDAPVIGEVNL